MGIIAKIAKVFERKGVLASPSPELLALFGSAPTAAGIEVNGRTALRSPATLAAIRAIADSLAIPAHVFKRTADGGRERDRDHPANALLTGDASPWMGAADLRMALQFDALTGTSGAGYAQVVRINGKPRELHRLDPSIVRCDDSEIEPRFIVTVKGGERIVPYQDMLCVATPGSAPGRPLSLIDCAREAIGVDLVMAQHQGSLFRNGARPSGVLETDRMFPDEATAERIRRQITNAWSGPDNAGKVAVLELGLKFNQTAFSSVDSQFLELRKFAVAEIARVFRVPLTLIGDLEHSSWNNIEQLCQVFLTFCLLPWLEVWQSALSRALLAPEERETHFIEFQIDDLVRADLEARFEAYRNAVGGSWLTANETRALDNRPPVAGGDVLLRQPGQLEAAA